ncbi:TIR domain-containing protein [Mesorhizobium loti]|uniref:TIR domain-containing protein n=1 Tax=Rhizobium loti TaxID=381 RepID=A0A8E2W9P8_RHILI|nr:TIR domain-containing protein [Mesorhizobium loti]PWJ89525.1 TIR domain-containing protein [Mesorhizobium loti]
MPVLGKRPELIRLQKAFEAEAGTFPDLSLSILYFSQERIPADRTFRKPNHQIMLWQYYGQLDGSEESTKRMFESMQSSNIAMAGLRGCQFSCCALLEGEPTAHFIRMAQRAGNIFSDRECDRIKLHAINDFASNFPPSTNGKPISCSNSNRLAIWLNHVLHHLGRTHPRYLMEAKIDIDPYAASLSAIDAMLATTKPKVATSSTFDTRRFRVALSFPGEHRPFVRAVAEHLKNDLGHDSVFYDNDYVAELARPNLDVLLQRIYHDNSDLIVVFLCGDYIAKEWCGLEWRAIRNIIKQRRDATVMLLRLDQAQVPGLFGIDGYIDVENWSPAQTAEAIMTRLRSDDVQSE